jgi:hypothetical protein
MKTRRFTPLFLASFGMAGLLTSACAKDAVVQPQPTAAAPAAAAPATQPPAPVDPAAAPVPAPAPAPVVPAAVPVPAPAPAVPAPSAPIPVIAASPAIVVNPDAANSWSNMKDLPFEQRSTFIAGLNRLEGIVDTEIGSLNARRASMTTDTKDWDFAMKGLVDDQTYLKSMNDEVSKVESENWIQERERVEAAWQNTQDAYAKVLQSTTAP